MPKILITNDDGIRSRGIKAAVEALQGLGKLYVVAPMFQRSASGRAMTLHRPLRAVRVKMAGVEAAYALDGMPVDCIIFAMARFGDFDLAVSGINLGENMSTEITISGTASAAIEAATHDIPSIAEALRSTGKNTSLVWARVWISARLNIFSGKSQGQCLERSSQGMFRC